MPKKPNCNINLPVSLGADALLEIPAELKCPRCSSDVRGVDAELLLNGGIRALCPNHHVVLCFEVLSP